MAAFIWFAVACVGGTAAILGSLMTIGTVMLWCIPISAHQNASKAIATGRVRLLALSVAIAIVGIASLFALPPPVP